jgi:hypothetical protein
MVLLSIYLSPLPPPKKKNRGGMVKNGEKSANTRELKRK